jgi:inorganic pyrophosphatase
MEKISVYVEIEKGSNIKYEYDKESKKLIVDRILDEPYVYPYAYGFIPNTMASDNDELDILIITDKYIKNNEYYDVYIIGCLVMEDEKGMDEKILCVLEEEYDKINNLNDLSEEIKESIYNFFSNYKKKDIHKWSNVLGFIGQEMSIELYKKMMVKMMVKK